MQSTFDYKKKKLELKYIYDSMSYNKSIRRRTHKIKAKKSSWLKDLHWHDLSSPKVFMYLMH